MDLLLEEGPSWLQSNEAASEAQGAEKPLRRLFQPCPAHPPVTLLHLSQHRQRFSLFKLNPPPKNKTNIWCICCPPGLKGNISADVNDYDLNYSVQWVKLQ